MSVVSSFLLLQQLVVAVRMCLHLKQLPPPHYMHPSHDRWVCYPIHPPPFTCMGNTAGISNSPLTLNPPVLASTSHAQGPHIFIDETPTISSAHFCPGPPKINCPSPLHCLTMHCLKHNFSLQTQLDDFVALCIQLSCVMCIIDIDLTR